MSFKLTELDKSKIKEAVTRAEIKTRGEIVPMILKRSDTYPAAHFRAAIFLALSLAFALYYFPFYEVPDDLYYIWVMIGGMLVGHVLCLNVRVKKFFLTKKEINEEVHLRALEAFFTEGIHTTRERTGILLFISRLEGRAEIVADCGINEKVEKDTWDIILTSMLQEMKRGEVASAIVKAIDSCGELLAKHFPKTAEEHKTDPNELSNEVLTD